MPADSQLEAPAAVRRLPRAARRDQILTAATRAFARSGFAATSLDDVAAESGISRVILYRHFESKTDLYRAVLDSVRVRLETMVGSGDFGPDSLDRVLGAAAEDPDGFRLLFHHAAREPEFRKEIDQLRAGAEDIAHRYLDAEIPDPAWAQWAAQLTATVAIDATIAWLDAGQPDRAGTAERIRRVLGAITEAAALPR